MRNLGPQAMPMLEPLLDGLQMRVSHPDTEALFRDTLLDHVKVFSVHVYVYVCPF